MTNQDPPQTASGPISDPLSEIEDLARRARAGEITEKVALERIGAMTRQRQTEDIYQKPWG